MVSKISEFWKNTIKGALGLVVSLLKSLTEDVEVQADIDTLAAPLTKVVDALADDNPEDGKQIGVILKQFTNVNLLPRAQEELQELLSKIADPGLQQAAKRFSLIPYNIGIIYTDDNPENDTQLKSYLELWVETKENQNVILNNILLPFLNNVVFKENPAIGAFIVGTIQGQLANLNIDIDGDGQ